MMINSWRMMKIVTTNLKKWCKIQDFQIYISPKQPLGFTWSCEDGSVLIHCQQGVSRSVPGVLKGFWEELPCHKGEAGRSHGGSCFFYLHLPHIYIYTYIIYIPKIYTYLFMSIYIYILYIYIFIYIHIHTCIYKYPGSQGLLKS